MDFKQKFEPIGNKVIHGAGQSPEMFDKYWNAMENDKPVIYMTYVRINEISKWSKKIFGELKKYPSMIPQIGYNFKTKAKGCQVKEISEGKYDKDINQLCNVLKKIKNPVFIRLGYEFDKANKHNPKYFVLAWKRMVDKFKENNINNIATVWCACPYNGTDPVEPFYPGDDYVNWFGIDVFTVKHFKDGKYLPVKNFLALAKKHKKPVMIGESSPARTGVDKGQESWDEWFEPYFKWIKSNPVIKAFCYINWDWKKDWKTPTWLNGRIHENEVVRKNLIKELKNPKYIHSTSLNNFINQVNR